MKRDIGVIAMKTSARGDLLEQGLTTIEENLRYVLSLPVSGAVVGMESVAQVRQNAAIVRDTEPLDEEAVAALLERLEPEVRLELEVYKRA